MWIWHKYALATIAVSFTLSNKQCKCDFTIIYPSYVALYYSSICNHSLQIIFVVNKLKLNVLQGGQFFLYNHDLHWEVHQYLHRCRTRSLPRGLVSTRASELFLTMALSWTRTSGLYSGLLPGPVLWEDQEAPDYPSAPSNLPDAGYQDYGKL